MANLFRCGGNAKKNYEISASGTTRAYEEGSWNGLSSSSVTVNGRSVGNSSVLIGDCLVKAEFYAYRNFQIPTACLRIRIYKEEEIIAEQTFVGRAYGATGGTVTCTIQL